MVPIITGGHISWKLFADENRCGFAHDRGVRLQVRQRNSILWRPNELCSKLIGPRLFFSHLVACQFERSRLLEEVFLRPLFLSAVRQRPRCAPLWAIYFGFVFGSNNEAQCSIDQRYIAARVAPAEIGMVLGRGLCISPRDTCQLPAAVPIPLCCNSSSSLTFSARSLVRPWGALLMASPTF